MSLTTPDWLHLAQDHHLHGRNLEALRAYELFLVDHPTHAAAWTDLGGLLMTLDRLPEARDACEQALRLEPDSPYARVNLGCVWMKQGRFREARELLLRVLSEDPQRIYARLALVECLVLEGDFEAALVQLGKVLEADPTNATAFQQVVRLHARRGNQAALLAAVQRRLSVVPDCEEARLEQAMRHLLLGSLPEAWDEFECRFQLTKEIVSIVEPFQQPRWEGQPFPGKTLLLHWEQGLGDTLMFIRYASLAKALGGQVLALVQPTLTDLVATCPGVDRVLPHGEALPPFDFHLPMLSLPKVFRTDLASIPAEIPYLGVPDRIPNGAVISQVLAASRGRIRIGYAWAGRPEHRNDANRTLPPELLAPLATIRGVAWHCFQVPPPPTLPLPSVPLGPILSNFSDTACALGGMDLIITVDTALAHAAGALGIPTLLLLPFDPDWRWMLDRSDTPWYPTLRLYRQPSYGDWASVIQAVLRDLSEEALPGLG